MKDGLHASIAQRGMFFGAEPAGRRIPAAAVSARVRDAPCVSIELNVVPGAVQGFDMDPSTRIAQRFKAVKIDALRRAFANGA